MPYTASITSCQAYIYLVSIHRVPPCNSPTREGKVMLWSHAFTINECRQCCWYIQVMSLTHKHWLLHLNGCCYLCLDMYYVSLYFPQLAFQQGKRTQNIPHDCSCRLQANARQQWPVQSQHFLCGLLDLLVSDRLHDIWWIVIQPDLTDIC